MREILTVPGTLAAALLIGACVPLAGGPAPSPTAASGIDRDAIPFNRYLGLSVEEVCEGRGVVCLPEERHLQNHIGTQHASALFAPAEAASGLALLSVFADLIETFVPLARSAHVIYTRPAKGPIRATATVEDGTALLNTLNTARSVAFSIRVTMSDERQREVASVIVDWNVRRRRLSVS